MAFLRLSSSLQLHNQNFLVVEDLNSLLYLLDEVESLAAFSLGKYFSSRLLLSWPFVAIGWGNFYFSSLF
ncbi:hypothetical protein RchiOBHm_Chr7g0209361 [Rosa chinensis]|uniref:Uncharacterized protein n=1 Tax=Rosa chinensis TaxID=74649 RepID=A0A2P6P9Y0_ROSCH|nr:hypothetical protein RchiOBHm_Chr7g0209361 [Rosa chinensis]